MRSFGGSGVLHVQTNAVIIASWLLVLSLKNINHHSYAFSPLLPHLLSNYIIKHVNEGNMKHLPNKDNSNRNSNGNGNSNSIIGMAGGEGGESEWAKALMENSGSVPGTFDKELQARTKGKLAGLNDPSATKKVDQKLSANARLIQWLQKEGDVYLDDASGWGEAPHPMAISTETVDELTNESSGRGLLARRNINQEEELLKIPLSLCITKKSARKALGTDIIPPDINEYLAMACQLIREKFVLGEESFYKPYMDVLPEVNEVNPTFTWSEEDLAFLEGSPVIAATKSMQRKLRNEYNTLLADEGKLCDQYPDVFPREYFTYENWVWAFTNLFSRAIRLRNMKQGETLAMVPYADLINHSPYSGAYLDAREVGDWLFKTGEKEVILYEDCGYRRMEQIYVSYGPKSNAAVALDGFALVPNPFNSVDVTVSIAARSKEMVMAQNSNSSSLLSSIVDVEGSADPLLEEKMEFQKGWVEFPCCADQNPTEMLEYLRFIMMTPEDTMGMPLQDFDYPRTISAANEAAILHYIIEAIQERFIV
eukprot:CAMPEP_0176493680 /NCGR_PEP_ID=MMETSP0200_2-20121128/9676_1 /TAXON_ID=947934 /ORGANISM="Chaetoceros sp., Strain GSL56" /LENGTH=537 /DNA_ID=CAMNT_0017891355 /DNA_START=344 /DNA_END=1959 /DNA_ORIENTATION=-